MNIDSLTKFVLAIISLLGAFFSWHKAIVSSKNADYIKKLKKEIENKEKKEIKNRENIEIISKVKTEVQSIEKIIRSYYNDESVGRNFKGDKESLEQSLSIIKENRYIFSNNVDNPIDVIYFRGRNLVDEMLSIGKCNKGLKISMRGLDMDLDNFLSYLNKLKDNNKFN